MDSTGERPTIAVLETVLAGFLSGDDADSTAEQDLIAEASMMLVALCDAIVAAGGRVETLIEPSFRDRIALPAAVKVHHTRRSDLPAHEGSTNFYGTNWARVQSGMESWLSIATRAEAAIAIAPEGDGLLASVVESMQTRHVATLNCSPRFVRFAGDKWLVAEFCRREGVPHPKTWLSSEWLAGHNTDAHQGGWCLKPRDGVGCVGLMHFDEATSLARFLRSKDFARSNDLDIADRWIVQRWVEGVPVSRGYIAGQDGLLPAQWMRQELQRSRDANCKAATYSFAAGSQLETPPTADATHSERLLIDALRSGYGSDLAGWIGIDYTLGRDGRLTVIEVNPRLTTTFAAVGNETAREELAKRLVALRDR